jgi:hypothetical protein
MGFHSLVLSYAQRQLKIFLDHFYQEHCHKPFSRYLLCAASLIIQPYGTLSAGQLFLSVCADVQWN